MVLQGQHARLVAEREQSMKLVEIYSKASDPEKTSAYLAEVETLSKDIKHVREQMNDTLENQNNKRAAHFF
jgi:aspartate/tyrosine/aromatic aminotransferase